MWPNLYRMSDALGRSEWKCTRTHVPPTTSRHGNWTVQVCIDLVVPCKAFHNVMNFTDPAIALEKHVAFSLSCELQEVALRI